MRILPCVIAFVSGIGVDRVVGFEGLGRGDSFTIGDLEARLLSCGVLVRPKMSQEVHPSISKGVKRVANRASEHDDDYDDDDWD